jgi:hypothetical protein
MVRSKFEPHCYLHIMTHLAVRALRRWAGHTRARASGMTAAFRGHGLVKPLADSSPTHLVNPLELAEQALICRTGIRTPAVGFKGCESNSHGSSPGSIHMGFARALTLSADVVNAPYKQSSALHSVECESPRWACTHACRGDGSAGSSAVPFHSVMVKSMQLSSGAPAPQHVLLSPTVRTSAAS